MSPNKTEFYTVWYGCGHKNQIHENNMTFTDGKKVEVGLGVFCPLASCKASTRIIRITKYEKQYMLVPSTNFKWKEHFELHHHWDTSTHTVKEIRDKHRMEHLMRADLDHTHEHPTRQSEGTDETSS